jgi:hypothetical protein
MSAGSQHVRIRLPRPLFKKLSARARTENTDAETLIVQAVAADLRMGRRPVGGAAKKARKPLRKTSGSD